MGAQADTARQSLVDRVFRTLVLVSVIAAIVATAASALLYQSTLMREASTELAHECEVISSTLNAAPSEIDELQSIELGSMRATIIAPDGSVLYDSLVVPSELASHGSRPEVIDALDQGAGSSVRSSDTLGNVSIYQAQRLRTGNVLRLSVDRAGIFSILLSGLKILAGVFLAVVVMSWLASRKLSERLVRPILEMDVAELAHDAPYNELQPLTDRLSDQQAELASQMEELRNAEAMRREFTANVTHELKTPIASIMGASELLRDGFVLEEDVPDFAARINTESQRLSALVNDILTLSRLDESERMPGYEPFGASESIDLMTVASDVRERMAARADAAEIALVLEGTSAVVKGHPRLLDELVSNLCSNAIRYNRPGGSVRIWVGAVDGHPTLRVTDTGIGIPEEAQAKVFERFYRVETSRSRASGGTGLGLAIVKHAATLHEAEVSLESQLGAGTEVTVTFPAA